MSFHHVAVATRDLRATHRFYTEAMGFTLVKVEVVPTETPGGWAKHAFYDTGDGMLAFWDLHDDAVGEFDAALSRGHGLPDWVNHLAFTATDRADLDVQLRRWLDFGIDVVEIDHGWCTSIYATDPDGTLVEWCTTTRSFTDDERRAAIELLDAGAPAVLEPPPVTIHEATRAAVASTP